MAKEKWRLKIEYVPIESLKEYANNAKIHTPEQIEQIKKSISEWGFNDPIALWKNNEIIEGHGRLIAAKGLGIKEVPVIRLDNLTDEQRRAYMLVHNKLTMNTDFDFGLLEKELESITDIDMSFFDFDMEIELGDREIERREVQEDDNWQEPEIINPETKPGDIWQLGRHRLICGDSTDKTVIERLMDGKLADMLITDPPYNVDYEGTAGKIQNDNMEDADFRKFLRDAFDCANTFMKPGAVFYIWHADSEGYNFRGACHDIEWQVRQCLIWNKNSLVLGRQDYQWKHEPCLYGWKDGGAHKWMSDRRQTTVIDWDRPTKSEYHPTMKPVGLFGYQIGNSSEKGDLILDLFGGSGTTIIACEQMDRSCYMSELDPKFCDVIKDRWEALTGQKAVLVNNNG